VIRLAAGTDGLAVEVGALREPDILRSVAGATSPEPAERRVRRAVERAVANGTLLRVTVEGEAGRRTYLLPATREADLLLDRLRAADPEAARAIGIPADREVVIYRPNVFALYERHIGPLTPLLAEQLRDAERTYPRAWIEDAILTAVQYNKHNWRYIEAILSRWEEHGAPEGAPSRR
jgi:DnaD/phage-associated family protein